VIKLAAANCLWNRNVPHFTEQPSRQGRGRPKPTFGQRQYEITKLRFHKDKRTSFLLPFRNDVIGHAVPRVVNPVNQQQKSCRRHAEKRRVLA